MRQLPRRHLAVIALVLRLSNIFYLVILPSRHSRNNGVVAFDTRSFTSHSHQISNTLNAISLPIYVEYDARVEVCGHARVRPAMFSCELPNRATYHRAGRVHLTSVSQLDLVLHLRERVPPFVGPRGRYTYERNRSCVPVVCPVSYTLISFRIEQPGSLTIPSANIIDIPHCQYRLGYTPSSTFGSNLTSTSHSKQFARAVD